MISNSQLGLCESSFFTLDYSVVASILSSTRQGKEVSKSIYKLYPAPKSKSH